MISLRTMISAAALTIALTAPVLAATKPAAVVENYANLAEAMYGDSLATAKNLQKAVDAFLAAPSDDTLKAARTAWKAARVPYQQTRRLSLRQFHRRRLGGQGECLAARRGPDRLCRHEVLRRDLGREPALYGERHRQQDDPHRQGRRSTPPRSTKELLGKLQEAGGVEANVATGYHAIEFLLWGQDLNGTGPGAGNRPATDYRHRRTAPTAIATAAATI